MDTLPQEAGPSGVPVTEMLRHREVKELFLSLLLTEKSLTLLPELLLFLNNDIDKFVQFLFLFSGMRIEVPDVEMIRQQLSYCYVEYLMCRQQLSLEEACKQAGLRVSKYNRLHKSKQSTSKQQQHGGEGSL